MPVTIRGTSGLVLQGLQVTNNTVYTISGSGTFTNMSITITPSSTSSKFLLMASLGQISQASGASTVAMNFARNGTNLNYISGGSYNGVAVFVDNNSNISPVMPCFNFLDSPNTTSAITYTVIYSTDGQKWVGRRGVDTFIAASQQFQVLEIAQ